MYRRKSDSVAGPASQEEAQLRGKGGSNAPALTTTSGKGVSKLPPNEVLYLKWINELTRESYVHI
ncbi:hypothetical protein [Parabacteroides leei]|uniref:hypothetical protein n=1 Tax=Parabacteroides leei TaxID=2939491 RepID=UPI001897B316|nr:hypothetical protein [Parabacteroides leei]MCL3853114.1 hypothetical protein [Parabacteroides leei]